MIRHKCMPGNIPGAIIGWREILKWNKDRLQACTDKFLPPSQFLADTMVKGGYSAENMQVLCNFIDVSKVQNPSLKNLLLSTGDKILAEACPYDKIWGIGLDANHPDSTDQSKWKGDNLLGKILMQIREELSTSK